MNNVSSSYLGIYKAIGSRLRDERIRRNITQDGLAQSVGMSRASITNIEKGRQKLTLHTLVALSFAMGLPPGELLSTLEPKTNDQIEALMPVGVSDSVRLWILSGAAKAPKEITYHEHTA